MKKKYLYLISKKCLLVAGILLAMFSSCNEDEILQETPLDFLAPENAYTTLAGIQQGIGGLFADVRSNWYYGPNYALTEFYGMAVDEAFQGEDPGSNAWLCNYQTYLVSTNSNIRLPWVNSYRIIQRANVVIKSINDSDNTIWTSDAQKNAYLAEAMFFRAYSYRILASWYGDVPLVDYVISSPKTDFVRAPKADIYKLMEDDLIFGTTNLPVPGKEEAPGRITQGAAWHLLSETYLTEGKYQLAVDAATKVISGYKYALMTKRFGTRLAKDVFGSGDIFFDLFGYGNHNLPENTESIWAIQYEPLITGGGGDNGNQGERGWGPAYFRMGNTPDGFKAFRGDFYNGKYTGYSDTLGRSVGWMRPTNYLTYQIWRSDWNNDIRNAKHNIKRNFYYDAPGSIYDKKKIDFSLYPASAGRNAMLDTNFYIFPYWTKNIDPCHKFVGLSEGGGSGNHKDVYAIRLAETILLRAEAYIRLNNLTAAAADINLIRNRANAKPVLPANVTLDYILDERARELYGEEFRPIVLRRMGVLVQRTRLYNNNPKIPGGNIQDYNDLYPIPQNQIDLNINAVLKQNPGY